MPKYTCLLLLFLLFMLPWLFCFVLFCFVCLSVFASTLKMAAQSIAHKYVSIEGDLVERGSLTQFAFVSVRLLLFRFHTVHIST